MKIQYIAIGTDGNEYTNNEMFKDFGCVQEYEEKPNEDQIKKDIEQCLLSLQFYLPHGVRFERCRYKVIED